MNTHEMAKQVDGAEYDLLVADLPDAHPVQIAGIEQQQLATVVALFGK
jgi:hypothetical protein